MYLDVTAYKNTFIPFIECGSDSWGRFKRTFMREVVNYDLFSLSEKVTAKDRMFIQYISFGHVSTRKSASPLPGKRLVLIVKS